MKLPQKFESILKRNETLHSIVLNSIIGFQPIYRDNKLFFFEEYTDHGIQHVENVLSSAEYLIPDETFESLTAKDVSILILSIIVHDIGMHCEFSTFVSMINGEYDKFRVSVLDQKTWAELWIDYLSEVKRFSSHQKKNIFGNEFQHFKEPSLENKDDLSGYDKKLIGEFIRRHHARLSHEIALYGLIGQNGKRIEFGNENLSPLYRKLVGIVARSHNKNLRETFVYLEEIAGQGWRNPDDVNIIFLMVVLRIADYIQIDNSRVSSILLKVKTFNSPVSAIEHKAHLAIESLSFNQPDFERIFVSCHPSNSEMLVKLKTLFSDIQTELDTSWAVLGEVYGFLKNKMPQIKFRRISSNLDDSFYLKKLDFIPQRIKFEVNNELSKLLVGPLYGNDPTFGVRELVQNAVDACIERSFIEANASINYTPKITVSIRRISDQASMFMITDNGKGMSVDEIIHYFLNVGSSFRKSLSWKKQFVDENGHVLINRNGKFGIGVLAAFLIGEELTVTTRHYNETTSYAFTTTIDSDFIDIKREITTTKAVGTSISLLISNDKREEILQDKKQEHEKKKLWTNWYINDYPQVVYFIDDKKIEKSIFIDRKDMKTFQTENFKKIEWKYFDFRRHHMSYNLSDTSVVCNGIVISRDLSNPKNRFIYSGNKYREYVIEDKPSFLFDDPEGIFPIKLDRNDIDCIELPFERELFTEVAKYFVAKILSLKIDINKSLHSIVIKNSNANILYHKRGYTLNFDYFTDIIAKLDLYLIRVITSNNTISNNYIEYEDCLIFPLVNEKINLSYQESNVAPNCSGTILLKVKNYDNLFRSETKRLSASVKREHIRVLENDRFIVYSYKNHVNKSSLFKSTNSLKKINFEEIESVQELAMKYFELKGGRILNKLLEKYIGPEIFIPYDISERRKLYKLAFEELAEFM